MEAKRRDRKRPREETETGNTKRDRGIKRKG